MPYSVSHVTRSCLPFPRRRPLIFPKVFREKESKSGGDGADRNEKGEVSDAKHSFEFMQGHLPTMMWEDPLRLQAGGDDNVGVGDAVIPDGKGGSGSSVPGGPGVRSTVPAIPAKTTSDAAPAIPAKTAADAAKISRKKKRDAAKADERSMQKLRLEASGLISKISAGIAAETAAKDALDDDEEDRRAEEAADNIDRLQGKVAAASDDTRKILMTLLEKARKKLAKCTEALAARERAEEVAEATRARATTGPAELAASANAQEEGLVTSGVGVSTAPGGGGGGAGVGGASPPPAEEVLSVEDNDAGSDMGSVGGYCSPRFMSVDGDGAEDVGDEVVSVCGGDAASDAGAARAGGGGATNMLLSAFTRAASPLGEDVRGDVGSVHVGDAVSGAETAVPGAGTTVGTTGSNVAALAAFAATGL